MAEENKKLAVVRIRGIIGLNQGVKDTLTQLRLHRKNYCVVLDDNKVNRGMVMKVKDFVTWGEVDDTTFNNLVEKKAEEYKGRAEDSKGKIKYTSKFTEVNGKKIKKFFRLNSPQKGYGRKGIKVPFKLGGSLGYRAEKINELIKRMM